MPKPDGRKRPIGVSATEDKIVQRAVVTVLNAIYEHDVIGFTHICGVTRKGWFTIHRRTIGKKLKLQQVKSELRSRMHDPIPKQGDYLRSAVARCVSSARRVKDSENRKICAGGAR